MAKEVKKFSREGLVRGRIGWNMPINLSCSLLAETGLHARTIADRTGLTVSQVHNRCKKVGLRLRDYRDGVGRVARVVLASYSVRKVAANRSIQRLAKVPPKPNGKK